MRMNFIAALRHSFALLFHERNIIIVSQKRVKHVPVSGLVQFFAVMMLAVCLCWSSYATGRFMAARSSLKEQAQALRSIASERAENMNNLLPAERNQAPVSPLLASPVLALPSFDNIKLYARVAFLEKQVADLRDTNETIIRRVHDKTAGRIDDLESVIRSTGLDPSKLKNKFSTSEEKPDRKAQGGPYVPDNNSDAMFDKLDELSDLWNIIDNLPLAKPVKNASMQSPFGHRIDPFNGYMAFHTGLDLAAPANAKIYSTAAGKVTAAGRNGAYGNAIDIDHGAGITTRYGHLKEIRVQEGQLVKKGDVIGIQGSTGRSTGSHLHYEVRYNDKPLNPKKFLEAGRNVLEN